MDEPSEALGYAEKALRFDPKHATWHQDVVDISGKLTIHSIHSWDYSIYILYVINYMKLYV